MKIKSIFHFYFGFVSILFIVMASSCHNGIDNYDAPQGGIMGYVLDEETNDPIPLPVQGNAGVLVNLLEQNTGATRSVDFRAKPDGTFEHRQVFNGDYRVVVNGPFVNGCEGMASITGQTTIELYATPFSRIRIDGGVTAANELNITYDVSKTDNDFTTNEVMVMWNFAPNIDINNSNYAGIANLGVSEEGMYTFELQDNPQFMNNLYKIRANQNRVYVRVAARVNNAVNYSQTLELQVN